MGKTVNEINQQIKQSCIDLGIEGLNISKELKQLPYQLGPIFNEIHQKSSKLENAYQFYVNYVEYFFQRYDILKI